MRPDRIRPRAVFGLATATALLGAALIPPTARAATTTGVISVTAAVPGAAALSAATGDDFPRPLDTSSRYFPLTPGQQYHYEGTVTDPEGTHRHTVVFTVTDLVKWVDGTNVRVILDEDYNDGVLEEIELAFFAQDEQDNVWTRGEYPEVWDNGTFEGAPSAWIGGVSGAKPGVLVPGHPRTGSPPFVEGRAPAVDFYDVGQVVATGLSVCVPAGCYSDVVKIKEWGPLAPEDGSQLKFYAPRVGLVKVTALGGDSQETLKLTRATRLDEDRLSQVRRTTLQLDSRAYRFSPDYRQTFPAHLPR